MLLYSAVLIALSLGAPVPDILSPQQKAPPHARSSAAGRSLARAGQTPANVGRLPQSQPKPKPAPPPSSGGAASQPQEDGVTREESTSFKEVNGETVRVVVGNYGYQSPEGLPVSFKYMADENGNQASFSIGTAAGGSGSGSGSGSKSRPGSGSSQRPGGSGNALGNAGKGGAGAGTKPGNQSGKNAGSPDGDRKYLPPS